MQQRDRETIGLIVRYCDRIAGYLSKLGNDKNQFLENQMCQDACCMCIAQIGELSARLSEEYKTAHADLPWREIKDTRNFYVHNYGGIDLEYVWNTMIADLPILKQKCRNSLEQDSQ